MADFHNNHFGSIDYRCPPISVTTDGVSKELELITEISKKLVTLSHMVVDEVNKYKSNIYDLLCSSEFYTDMTELFVRRGEYLSNVLNSLKEDDNNAQD